jgi:alanine dehydrogenase
VVELADQGASRALLSDPGFLSGLAVTGGLLTSEPVALAQNRVAVAPREALTAAPAST